MTHFLIYNLFINFDMHLSMILLEYPLDKSTSLSFSINSQISQTSLQLLTNTLLFGNSSYSDKTNTHILNATIDYIRLTKRFDEPLF